MILNQKFNVKILDVKGNLLFEFKDVKPSIQAETFTVTNDGVKKNQIIEIKCIAENAITGEYEPVIEKTFEKATEETQNLEEAAE
ncbi:hypothetical protein LN42_00600 [Marinitoga sp. 1137]|uniref:hypothetical protein n=1 Tax=Marinitoga sp. 1137 TaxID=1545835 RepID=UPI0009506521|nr:hypothetical protein [Marinitoga sp. 1137]APT75060.1 hypothetical protein LN42_00600 [Marinitoga sp. 1137]